MEILFIWLAVYCAFCYWVAYASQKKGRSPYVWFFVSFFTSPLVGALFTLALKNQMLPKCPECGEFMNEGARTCKHCGHKLTEEERKEVYAELKARKEETEKV